MSDVPLNLAANAGVGPKPASDLLPLVYEELRRLAAIRMAGEPGDQTLQPTALVHEAWLRMSQEGDRGWQDRTHFFRAAALAMRRILVDRARHKLRQKRGGGANKVAIDEAQLTSATTDDRVLLVDQCMDRLEKEDPESARVVLLKFFGGLTNKEVASLLDTSERSVERQWTYAKALLLEMIERDN